jgi:hypothetical protein
MSWQLWLLIGLIAAGVVIQAVTRMRHAQHVFADITRTESSRPDPSGDELSIARAQAMANARRTEPETGRRRAHG